MREIPTLKKAYAEFSNKGFEIIGVSLDRSDRAMLEEKLAKLGITWPQIFDGKGWGLRLLEVANDLRAVYLGISFGDQVQFFRRRPIVEHDVYPAIPLMEDVELSLRLQGLGRRVFLFGDVVVSARSWQVKGVRRVWPIARLLVAYLGRRMTARPVDAAAMYRRYYR